MSRIFSLCLLLAACAQPWQQAGASRQDFYRDNSACLAQAGPLTPVAQSAGPAAAYNQATTVRANSMHDAIYEQCMLGKGWHHGSY